MLGVEPVGFSPPVLAGDGDARCVDNEGLDATRPQPARQPKTIVPGLKGDRYARDCVPELCRLVASPVRQPEQRVSSAPSFFNG
ncbi:hypothetical protein [Bradyrhizobium genosp. A]|uniref:hypothetical protein n=1 Tax=Bradyrhizobium genosp. A TaxID=83626 RepID=UPI003CF83C31